MASSMVGASQVKSAKVRPPFVEKVASSQPAPARAGLLALHIAPLRRRVGVQLGVGGGTFPPTTRETVFDLTA